MAISVKLRKKPISEGRQSLYLDFYPPIPNHDTGKLTRREFLGMYLFDKPKNPIDKLHNKETLQRAESIRQKRETHINKSDIYTAFEREQLLIKERGKQNFVEYFKKLADKRKASNHDNWVSAYKHLVAFTNGFLSFADLNQTWCNDYKDYLLTAQSNKSNKTMLSQNSAHSYFNKTKAALKQAFKDGMIQTDLNAKIESIKAAETRRYFLTIDEVNKLIKTDCDNPLLKRAAIFSALTGLRFSDIKNLVWGEIEYIEGNGYFINFKQQKTKGVEMQPISEQAYSLLGERKQPKDKVFEDLIYSAYENLKIDKWVKDAGINKHIRFHNFRHTFATLQLSLGTDIYTVSKMLGHRELKTTQIYAKIIDETKREAANKIKFDL